ENNEEIVVIEAIVTSESTKSVEDIQPLFSKTIRIDKRRMKPERTKISRSAEETKSMVLKVFQEAYPQDLYIVEASMKAGVSDPTGAMYIRILEAEGKVEFTRQVGMSKMFQLKK
ncbi:unnamed protein product, partial [marine sediment metagenome]